MQNCWWILVAMLLGNNVGSCIFLCSHSTIWANTTTNKLDWWFLIWHNYPVFCRRSCLVLYLSQTFMSCGGSMFFMWLFWVTPVNKWLHLLQRWKNKLWHWLFSVWRCHCAPCCCYLEKHPIVLVLQLYSPSHRWPHSHRWKSIPWGILWLCFTCRSSVSVRAPVETLLVFQLSAAVLCLSWWPSCYCPIGSNCAWL